MNSGGKLNSLSELPCGCSLRDGGIYFCGLHGSAGLLLKALKMFLAQYDHGANSSEAKRPEQVAARVAIREAEDQNRARKEWENAEWVRY